MSATATSLRPGPALPSSPAPTVQAQMAEWATALRLTAPREPEPDYLREARMIASRGSQAAALQGVLMTEAHYVAMFPFCDALIDANRKLNELLSE